MPEPLPQVSLRALLLTMLAYCLLFAIVRLLTPSNALLLLYVGCFALPLLWWITTRRN